jgi:hypothetical protein
MEETIAAKVRKSKAVAEKQRNDREQRAADLAEFERLGKRVTEQNRLDKEQKRKEIKLERDTLANRILGQFQNQDTGRKLNPLLERGSSQAFNAIRRNLAPSGRKTVEEITKQVLAEDKKSNATLIKILAAVDKEQGGVQTIP